MLNSHKKTCLYPTENKLMINENTVQANINFITLNLMFPDNKLHNENFNYSVYMSRKLFRFDRSL